jgi:dephospho-CoA kinase
MRDKKQPPSPGQTRHYGLTGGIASGKSTVRRLFQAHGAVVIDADELARQVVEPGQPAHAEIAAAFPGVVDPKSGALDRKKLAGVIFSDPAARRRLNEITHPRIGALAQRLKDEAEAQGARVVIYEAPLLIENGLHQQTDGVVLISLPAAVQQERLQKRDGLSAEEAKARIAAQLSLEEKRKVARWVIDNGSTLEATVAQVDAVWNEMLGS